MGRVRVSAFWKFCIDLSQLSGFRATEIQHTTTCHDNWQKVKPMYKLLYKLDEYKNKSIFEHYITEMKDYQYKVFMKEELRKELQISEPWSNEYENYVAIYGNDDYLLTEEDFYQDFHNANEHLL